MEEYASNIKEEIVDDLIAKIFIKTSDQQKVQDTEEVLTEKEAAEFLRIKPRTVQQWRLEGKIRSFQEGRIVRYLKSDLINYLKTA